MYGHAQEYIQLLRIALALGIDLVEIIRSHAKDHLSVDDYAALEAAWQWDVEESAKNAGLEP